jgi:SAM-dependent methyltransferase
VVRGQSRTERSDSTVTERSDSTTKQRGDYPTPHWLVDRVVDAAISAARPGAVVVVVDPACGDGRFLAAAARRIEAMGGRPLLVGCDIDPGAVRRARLAVGGRVSCADALAHDWAELAGHVDIVVGNPPYLSQLASATTRGGASPHGGGPYADAAVEFLSLALRLARPDGGRIGLVLPQSILASRDAAPVRAELDRRGSIVWAWWSRASVFDAQVRVCGLVAETSARPGAGIGWTEVVTRSLGVPVVPELATDGALGDRCRVTANFRDQYYGLVGSVVEDGPGPPLVPSGLIDPATCCWGRRPVTFARRRFLRPTVELERLRPQMRRWADALLVPKVLVANQTRVVEAVVDEAGGWLPGVPALTARPVAGVDPWALGAVLTSPVATVWAWQRAAGTGLSAGAVRLGPRWLAELPWPRGDLTVAIGALRAGDVAACGEAVVAAYGVDPQDAAGMASWWSDGLPQAVRVPTTSSHPDDGGTPPRR